MEFYDLDHDARQQAPMVPELHSTTARELRAEVFCMLQAMRAMRDDQEMPPVLLSPEQERQLESLGYIVLDDGSGPPMP